MHAFGISSHRARALRAPLAVTLLVAAAVAVAGAGATARAAAAPAKAAGDIPARPDDLKYPPLKFEPPKAADYRVTLKNGMVAYLVPDSGLPLVNLNVLMRLGPDLDPVGKEWAVNVMVQQLTRGGTTAHTAEQIEDMCAALGAQLDSQMGGGGRGMMGIGGVPIGPAESRATLNLLAKDFDKGLALLVECLKTPAFQADRLQLAKDQQIQSMKERNDAAVAIEGREWSVLMRGQGHWTNRYATQASVASITKDDLVALQRKYVGPRNFILAVSGDFDRAAMIKKLDAAFAGWPTPGERPGPPPSPTADAAAGWYMVDKDINQARVSIGLRGIDRYDPDYFAMVVMNDILGGGGFTSRLVNRIRSDEGLAYSVRASLEGGTYYPDPWRVSTQTKVRSTAFAIQVALQEIQKMRDTPVTAEELETAKAEFIGTFPTQFETAGSVAGALAVEELTGRYQKDPKFFQDYRDRMNAVTVADVQRAAKRLLDPSKLTYLIVGKVNDIMLGDPKHEDASIAKFAGGQPKLLPLRDPMTMQPMASQ